MEYSDLSNFFNENEIPIEEQKLGFLEIIKKAHNETINSNIYAHFLSCEDDEIKYVFLRALLEIIETKSEKELRFSNHYVLTEFSTDKGRVDIVVKDLIQPSTIIIENKLYHWLHNDLEEYWTFFNIPDANKVGVLLTLEPNEIPSNVKGNFINITHWEWIEKIKDQLNFDLISNNAYKIYVTDFFNSIERLSTTYKMNDSAKFYFEHASQVKKANHTLNEGHKFMAEQYALIASKLGLETYGNDVNWVNIWDEDNVLDTYFTITNYDIMSGSGHKYKIILELNRKDKDRLDEVNENFKNHLQYKDKFRGESVGTYCHFLVKEYDISLEDLNSFANHVVDNIVSDFGEIFIAIINHLYPEKNIENWKYNFLKN
ncbi:PD-(D/E)XK nuclease family protein [Polaribacter sp. Z022]|uniref:PD-(D/E)XK nuclease family protein n=1 Tax=Polaribacter sp. Z022 TaxID=2927125 RepID=UPI002020F696|nr:PD-(D/E)XK nuclease family protein [Polaribacter sp. Z022]MCL7752449.1 PD-(D/E)XK nuclease family protein [Polaribacter sp. Z022]